MNKYLLAAGTALALASTPAAAVTFTNLGGGNLNVTLGANETGFNRKLTNSFNWLIRVTPPTPFDLATTSVTISLASATTSVDPSLFRLYTNACTRTGPNACTGGMQFMNAVTGQPALGATSGPLNAFIGLSSTQFTPGSPFTIRFVGTSTGTPNAAFSLDYGFAAVPEPTTWAMMIVGVGAAGGMMRRRRALKLA